MQASAEVVIIGAGVIGCSTAYHLAKIGVNDVVVVEKDQVGAGSSSKSASMLSLQFSQNELIARMARYSYERYMLFEEEVGVPVDFNKIGWIYIASAATSNHLRRRARMLRSIGIRTEILEPREIHKLYPELNLDGIEVGSYGADDGPIDPHMIMWGYIGEASRLGVRLHQGVQARAIRVEKGRVQGVFTDEGFIDTQVVVNAGGPWAGEIGRWVGIEIPLENSARTIVVTDAVKQIPPTRPFVEDLGAEWYIRPEGEGFLMGMGKQPTDEFDTQTDYQMVDEIIRVAFLRVPILKTASILTSWTGIRPLTPDSKPILGPVAGVDGMILNCGWGGMGIIQAPAAGQLIAEYIHDGHTSTFSIDAMGIDRFQGQAADV